MTAHEWAALGVAALNVLSFLAGATFAFTRRRRPEPDTPVLRQGRTHDDYPAVPLT